MKVKLFIVRSLIFILLIGILTSCSNKSTVETNNISLYLLNNSNRTDIKKAIDKFNSVNKVKIDIKNYSKEQEKEYYDILATELMSGIGPDIVLIEDRTLKSVYKAMATDVFFDLNKLISYDEAFNFNGLNKTVLDSGVYSGKRYLMSLGYNINVFAEDKETKQDSHTSFDTSNWTWDYLEEACADYINKNKNKYVIFSDSERLFSNMLMNNIDTFIDFENKTCNFNSAKFIELLNIYKTDIFPSIIPGDEIVSDPKFYKRIIFQNISMLTRAKWYSDETNIKKNYYLMPTINGEKNLFINPCYSIGITNKCNNKKEAYEFIKLMLTEEIQDLSPCIPVNNNSYIRNANFYIKNINSTSVNIDSNIKEIDRELIKSQYNEIQTIGECKYIDYSIIEIINSELADFLKSKVTAEKAAARIDEKVKLCLNE